MPVQLTCTQGHRWQTVQSEGSGPPSCPVCGGTPQTIPPETDPSPRPAVPPTDLFTLGEDVVRKPPPPEELLSGRFELPGYEILEELGRGGMGVVYKARQSSLNRLVAIKMVLSAEHAGAAERARFRAEAEAVAQLQHPNIVQIYEVGEHARRPYFALELVEGGSLAQQLDGTPVPPREAAQFVKVLAGAMHHAHERGIVHRDLKPANILLVERGAWSVERGKAPLHAPRSTLHPKITDFGLAKRLDSEGGQTRSGAIMGTPSYMAPEQADARKREIGPSTDVYALGAILYELLTGRPPFRGDTPLETLRQVSNDDPVPPTRLLPRCPRDLETICLTCLEKEAYKRYSSARALADDLARFLSGESIRARPSTTVERALKWARRRPALAGLVLVTGLAAAVLLIISWVYYRQLNFALEDALKQGTLASAARTEAEQRARDARVAQEKEQEQRLRAEREKRRAARLLYAAHMSLAQQEWAKARSDRVLDLLERHHPSGGEDLRGFEWYYLWRLTHGSRRTFGEHNDPVWSAAFSPDGRRVVSAAGPLLGPAGEVLVWNADSGEVLVRVTHHAGRAEVAFSPDGRRIASGGMDANQRHVVLLWDATTGEVHHVLSGHTGTIRAIAFSPDGRWLASASEDRTIRLWNMADGQPGPVFHGATKFTCLAFSPDSKRLAAGGFDLAITVWDVAADEPLSVLHGHRDQVSAVAFSPNGKWLATAARDHTVRLWDATTGQETLTLRLHPGQIECLAFSPDSKRLAGGGDQRTIHLWSTATGEELFSIRGHADAITDLAFSPDGRRLLSASKDETVKVWDAEHSPEWDVLPGSTQALYSVAYRPDGRELAAAGAGRVVHVWDAQGRLIHKLGGHADAVVVVAYSPDGSRLASASRNGTVYLWDVAAEKVVRTLEHEQEIDGLAFAPDGKRLATAGQDRTVKLWDLATGDRVALLRHPAAIASLAFNRSGTRLATAAADGGVRLWDVGEEQAVGEQTWPLQVFAGSAQGHQGAVNAVTFSPDGTLLASAGEDRTIKIWDVSQGRLLGTLTGHSRGIRALAFTPAGDRLASAGDDQTIKLWDVHTGEETLTLQGHAKAVAALTFRPDGQRLASCGYDDVVRLWDAPIP